MNQVMERTPAVIAGEINYIKRQAQQTLLAASVEIGRKLNEAKALVPHGMWEEWLSENVDYSQSTANNLMRIATEYGDEQVSLFSGKSNSETFAALTYSQAVALFALPMDQRQEFVEEHDMETLSTRDLKEEIAALKAKEEKLLGEIEKLEEENAEAERDCTAAADDLEVAQKALREAESAKRNAETMLDAAKKLADANAKEKDKAVAAKAAAEKKEADLQKQLNEATEEIRRLEAEAQEKPEQITMEAAVSEEALEAQREKIAAEEREKLQEELRAEYEKKLSAAANPDAQRAAMHFESMVNSYGQLKKALERLPEDMAAKIRAKVSQAVAGMVEEMSDDAS